MNSRKTAAGSRSRPEPDNWSCILSGTRAWLRHSRAPSTGGLAHLRESDLVRHALCDPVESRTQAGNVVEPVLQVPDVQ